MATVKMSVNAKNLFESLITMFPDDIEIYVTNDMVLTERVITFEVPDPIVGDKSARKILLANHLVNVMDRI